jgi:hypothetical protein
VAKAVAYLAAPTVGDAFWRRWAEAVAHDRLREKAECGSAAWKSETETGLLVEMFAAYALRDGHERWAQLPAVHAFLRDWRENLA